MIKYLNVVAKLKKQKVNTQTLFSVKVKRPKQLNRLENPKSGRLFIKNSLANLVHCNAGKDQSWLALFLQVLSVH